MPRPLERVVDIDLQRCPGCGAGRVKIVAAILERAAIGKILTRLGLDPQPPPSSKAREAGARGPRVRRRLRSACHPGARRGLVLQRRSRGGGCAP